MNKIATLIVIDDSTEAYQLCRQLSPELVGTILDLNLNYSRSITQDDISRSIKRNSEDFITYEEMSIAILFDFLPN